MTSRVLITTFIPILMYLIVETNADRYGSTNIQHILRFPSQTDDLSVERVKRQTLIPFPRTGKRTNFQDSQHVELSNNPRVSFIPRNQPQNLKENAKRQTLIPFPRTGKRSTISYRSSVYGGRHLDNLKDNCRAEKIWNSIRRDPNEKERRDDEKYYLLPLIM
ncbi:uncharacterized protein [Lepeophtheirus salmonis]|uniref:uncharacterized protein isoform X2 n=1 Tax=Lepeophtheirus salmonis TaxID=72036 RepID=UPI003AF38E84